MEIVGKKSQGLSVTALNDDKTVIISFNDRSLNFYVTDSLKESLKETINSKIEDGFQHFILNLDNVKIIDSCGVGLIIVANNVTASRNAKLYLSNIKPFIIKDLRDHADQQASVDLRQGRRRAGRDQERQVGVRSADLVECRTRSQTRVRTQSSRRQEPWPTTRASWWPIPIRRSAAGGWNASPRSGRERTPCRHRRRCCWRWRPARSNCC
ncbi:MAG: STAS domain-containing protein [Planctomycetes bacterium]|nr:STAS domain-containing protein [Planctomycetota bacterium]